MRMFIVTVCLSACVSTGSVEAPITVSPQHNRDDQASRPCELVPPTAAYVAARFSHVHFMLPPTYSIMVPEPGELSDTAIWITPDSSVFFIGFGTLFGFDESSKVVAEGSCVATVLSKEVSVDLQHVSPALRSDTAFVGLTAVSIDSLVTIDVGIVARSAAERQRLIGVLTGFAVTPPSSR